MRAKLDQRELALHEVAEGRVAEPLGAGLEVFHVLLVGRVDRLAAHVGRQVHGGRGAPLVAVVVRRRRGRRLTAGRRLLDSAPYVAVHESRRLLVDVEREAVVRPLAVVAVHARRHAVRHYVLAYSLQLVLRAILQVEERFQAHLLALRCRFFGLLFSG